MKRLATLPVVRAFGQFGPNQKPGTSIKLFLDDARNPPLNEQGWVVVRTVADAIDFCHIHGKRIITLSLDNDLGPDPQGIDFLKWVLAIGLENHLPILQTVMVHTGNLPKWRMMMRLLRETKHRTGIHAIRRVPHDRVYPRASADRRKVTPYIAKEF